MGSRAAEGLAISICPLNKDLNGSTISVRGDGGGVRDMCSEEQT